MPLPAGVRRRLPQGGMTRTTYVDHWPADPRGDMLAGFIRVPMYLVGTKDHTNERLQFLKLIRENVKRWVEWKAKTGWFINGTPSVAGPMDPPTERTGAKPIDLAYPEHKRYIVTARFTREDPLKVPLDGARYLRDQADMYGVDLRDSSEVKDSHTDDGPDEIIDTDQSTRNPMEQAAVRRDMLGLKRENLLLGPLGEPLGHDVL